MNQPPTNVVPIDPDAEQAERGPKDTPKLTAEEKHERHKRALQRIAREFIAFGSQHGLTGPQVSALREALDALGWLPPGRL